MTPLQYRIRLLIRQHGSLRAAARVLRTDAAYLHRLNTGEKANPSAALLRRMGLRRVVRVHYERILCLWLLVGSCLAMLAGCGPESRPSAELAATPGTVNGHTITQDGWSTYCGPTCLCEVIRQTNCAEAAVWITEGHVPAPRMAYQDPHNFPTPLPTCGGG